MSQTRLGHGMLRVLYFLTAGILLTHAQDRPNILWITVEDMSAHLGCYGDAYAHTPHLDRFAKESVRYTQAYATAPVCSPSRSCLITGVYAQTLGTHQMRSAFAIPQTIRAWPAFLRAAGYHTTNRVKTDYNTSSEPRLIEEAWNESSPQAHWRQRSQKAQPFFAVFNDMTTHQSRSMTWPYAQFQKEVQALLPEEHHHDPDKAPVPPYYPDTPVIRKTIARHYDCISVMDANTGALLQALEDDGLEEDTIVFFFSDHGRGLPRGKRVLHDSGMHVPLMIRFPSKYQHLAPAQPGETVDRLVSFVDFPPTVLSLLGLTIPEYMQGIPFLGAASATQSPRQVVYGARDRVDEVFDFSRSVRTKDFLYIRNYMPHYGWNQRSVYPDQGEIRQEFYGKARLDSMNQAQRAFAGPTRPEEELYAVVEDPHQIHNLASNETHAETLAQMRTLLREQALATRDLGFLDELDQHHMTQDRTAYELGRDPQHFPLADAITDAATRFQPRESSEDVLVQQLASEHPFIVLRAVRELELRKRHSSKARKAVETTLAKWGDRKDTPLGLFIRFCCQSILGIHEPY